MAVYLWLRGTSWLFYFLVYLGISSSKRPTIFHPRFNKFDIKRNDFDGSVSTVNGQVFVNWSTVGPWNSSEDVNFTVYFLTDYSNNGTSPNINISTCFATKVKNGSWQIVPLRGNLLNFCNESQLCRKFDDNVFLLNSYWMPLSKELSCHLFTTCSNFNSTYGIQIRAVTGQGQYSYYIGNLSIYSQNIPPSPTNLMLDDDQTSNNQIGILWDYPDPSQLCGFGSNVQHAIHFVIEYYKSNHCLFLEKRTVNFSEHHAKFSNIPRQNVKYIFYLSATSSTNNLSSRPWQKQIAAKLKQDTQDVCFLQDGILSIHWQPEWNCHEIDVVNVAMFCPSKLEGKDCIHVCQGTLFKNGTVQVISFSRKLINFCHPLNNCQLNSNGADMVDISWHHSSGTMKCHIFKQCTLYLSRFTIKLVTFARTTGKIMAERDLCNNIDFLEKNYPPSPSHLHVIERQQSRVILGWKFNQCETFSDSTKIHISVRSLQTGRSFERVVDSNRSNKSSWMEYIVTDLDPFTTYQMEIYANNDLSVDHKSNTLRLNVTTKEGAPLRKPDITDIRQEKHGIRLTWKLRGPLQGIPRQVFIEILGDQKNIVGNRTIDGRNITSTVIDCTDLKKCYFFKVKVCNLPDLCSPFSDPKGIPFPRRKEISSTWKGSSKIWIITIILTVVIVIMGLLVWCVRRRRRRSGSYLPPLMPVPMECDSGYIGIGETSQLNEYDELDNEHLVVDK